MAEYRCILVCGDVQNGKITTTTKEILTIGKNLCERLDQPLNMLLIGEDTKEAANEAVYFDVNKVFNVNDLSFSEVHPDLNVATISGVCQKVGASILLLSHTDMGRDAAPRVAARLGTTVVMDCIDLAIDLETKKVLFTKPVYGGNANAIWIAKSNELQIATIRPRSAAPAEPGTSKKGEIVAIKIDINDSMIKSRLLETGKIESRGIKLEEAKVIVAGGGGIGSHEGFELLEELAEVLCGTVGVTRVPCDEGWMPVSLEIGQTGRIVNPNLYIAVGISGAIQHMAGCSGSKYIVAINKDPEARIFREANLGVIDNYREILPPLIEKLRKLDK